MSLSNPQTNNILAVSFCFPPLAYPRSIQVARLINNLSIPTTILCAEEKEARRDETIEPDVFNKVQSCVRVPFRWTVLERLFYKFGLPRHSPDRYRVWAPAVFKKVDELVRKRELNPDVLITFAQPFSVHLIGLELHRRYGWKWISHWSDPWTENPYFDMTSRLRDRELEKSIIDASDRLVFPCQETLDVVAKDSQSIQKSRIVPHAFDSQAYPKGTRGSDKIIVIRYIGNFYGTRSSLPLINALRELLKKNRLLLGNVRFELIGGQEIQTQTPEDLPRSLFSIKPPVKYQESLKLMVESDALLVIDAPLKKNVFLPSKLIDYAGSGQPVFGITSSGASEKLISKLGGFTADPANVSSVATGLERFIKLLRKRKGNREVWGNSVARAQYDILNVSQKFESILGEII